MSEENPVQALETASIKNAVESRIKQEEDFLNEFETHLNELDTLVSQSSSSAGPNKWVQAKRKLIKEFLRTYLQGNHEEDLTLEEMVDVAENITHTFDINVHTLNDRGVITDQEALTLIAGNVLRMEKLRKFVQRFNRR